MSAPKLHTFIVLVEDKPGVLNRVASLFRRRGYSIESLAVAGTEQQGISRITMVAAAEEDAARRLEANLYKLVHVLHVEDVTNTQAVVCELALVKVRADVASRPAVLQLVEVLKARAVDVTPSSVLVELTGPRDHVDRLIEVLRPHGIIELVRTGAVAVTRGPRALLASVLESGGGETPPGAVA